MPNSEKVENLPSKNHGQKSGKGRGNATPKKPVEDSPEKSAE